MANESKAEKFPQFVAYPSDPSRERLVHSAEEKAEFLAANIRPEYLYVNSTDTAFFYAGRRESDIHSDIHLKRIRMAEAAGVSTSGKLYLSGLASYPGDPTAWVSDGSDIRRVAREKNMTLEGSINQKGHEVEPTPPVDIAPDILERRVAMAMAQDPGQRIDDVRERERALATGQVDLDTTPRVSDHNFGMEAD